MKRLGFVLLACTGGAAWAHDIAVSAAGGFDEAVQAVSAFRRANPDYAKPVVVTFASGTRYLDNAIRLGREVSGTAESPTIFRAAPGGDVVFSGGVEVKDWTIGTDGVWSAPVKLDDFLAEQAVPHRETPQTAPKIRFAYFDEPDAVPNAEESQDSFVISTNDYPFTQLFVNDARRFRPRYPENGYFHIAARCEPADGQPQRGDHRFCWDAKDGLRTVFRNSRDVDVCAFLIQSMSRHPLAGVTKGTTVSNNVVGIYGRTCGTWGLYQKGYPYLFENVYETFKRPGQWYWDRQTSRLLYRPLPGETPDSVRVVLPRLTRLMVARCIRHVRFEGIQFAHAAWRRGYWGGINPQGELHSYSAVILWGAQHCRFDGCCFRNTGSYALNLTRTSEDNLVADCEFFDIGAGCIKVIGSHNVVRGCDLGYFGRVQPGGTGVMVHIANNVRIEDCNIHDAYYMGVNIGYSFGYRHPKAAHDNAVCRNHIWHLGDGILADQGGVYVVGVNEGTVVADNLIHDISARLYGGWGLYTDEGAVGVRMTGNVVYNTQHAGFHQHFGQFNTIANNVFVDCGDSQSVIAKTRCEPGHSFDFTDNVLVWTSKTPVFNGAFRDDAFTVDRNFYFNPSNAPAFPKDWFQRGHDAHSTVGVDPLFVDAANRDYRLRSESPVYSKTRFRPLRDAKPGRTKPLVFAPRFPAPPSAWEPIGLQ